MDNYDNLSREQLESLIEGLHKKLESATNKLAEKKDALDKSLRTYDLNGLKNILNENESLNEYDWNTINFMSMKAKDINFYLYISQLPDYEHYNKNNNTYTKLTKNQEAIYASLKDKKLFDFFINQPETISDLNLVLSDYGIDPEVDREVVKELFKRKLLDLESDKDLTGKFIERKCFNFMAHVLEQAPDSVDKKHYEIIYTFLWPTMPDYFLDIMKKKFPEYSEISVWKLSDTFESSKSDSEKLYKLIKHNNSNYIRILEEHKTTAFDIGYLLDTFQEYTPVLDKEFHQFVEVIANKKPEHIPAFKRFNCHTDFWETFSKALSYLDIQSSLEKNNTVDQKKIKL